MECRSACREAALSQKPILPSPTLMAVLAHDVVALHGLLVVAFVVVEGFSSRSAGCSPDSLWLAVGTHQLDFLGNQLEA